MKREDILQLISNLKTAADLSLGLGGITGGKVEAVQERLARLCISEFLKACEVSAEKQTEKKSGEKYTAPKPPPTLITSPIAIIAKNSDAKAEMAEKRTGDRNEERANGKDVTDADAQFMVDLAKQISALPNKRRPIAELFTQDIFERAYSIAGSRAELVAKLGISKATVQRLCTRYMPNDEGGDEDE